MLGTVQFGLTYGIANRVGQPSYRQVLDILTAALEAGVNCLDTAAIYGTSEEVIGRALSDLGIADRMIVVTKVEPLAPVAHSPQAAAKAIADCVERSLKRLRLEVLPFVLFHNEEDAVFMDALLELKAKGRVRHAGVSCKNRPEPATALLAAGTIEAMQLPVNVLDRRHPDSGVLRTAAAQGVAVFVRSVYLQGLLLMPEGAIPDDLRDVLPVRRNLERIASKAGMGMAELAMRYILSLDGATCVLTGVDSVEQLLTNLRLFGRGSLDPDLVKAVETAAPELPEAIVTPWMWKHQARFSKEVKTDEQ